MDEEKKIGDWVIVNDWPYQIQDIPDIFLSNEFASQGAIDCALNLEEHKPSI